MDRASSPSSSSSPDSDSPAASPPGSGRPSAAAAAAAAAETQTFSRYGDTTADGDHQQLLHLKMVLNRVMMKHLDHTEAQAHICYDRVKQSLLVV